MATHFWVELRAQVGMMHLKYSSYISPHRTCSKIIHLPCYVWIEHPPKEKKQVHAGTCSVLKSQVLMVEILNGRCFSPPFQKIASHFLDTIKWQSFQPFQRKLHVMLMCRFLILKSSPKEKKITSPKFQCCPQPFQKTTLNPPQLKCLSAPSVALPQVTTSPLRNVAAKAPPLEAASCATSTRRSWTLEAAVSKGLGS